MFRFNTHNLPETLFLNLKIVAFFFSFVFVSINETNGQMLIGGPNHAPEEVKTGAVNEGSVSGDVNVYTGTYDLSHTLGTVSGINGLSFTLTASYSSVVNTGTLAPSFKGFPMGEGWSLNLPSISCQVEDYEKYSRRQAESVNDNTNQKMFYLQNEISVEKANFFMNVNYSIPGVGSGKLVYIYSKGADHFFSPNAFESPILAVLNSGRWEITAPNGDRYEFVGNPSLRENGNLRTHKYRLDPRAPTIDTTVIGVDTTLHTVHPEGHLYNHYSPHQQFNIKPREVVAEWFCTRISNPFASGDAIFFDGEPYGKKLDQFGVWRQEALKEAPFSSGYSGIPEYYQGFLLKKVRSGTEELELNYERVVPETPQAGGGAIEDVDIMYARQAIYDSEVDGDNDWKRFKHVAGGVGDDRIVESSFYDGFKNTNPYLEQVAGGPVYNVDHEVGPINAEEFRIPFSHGYLESPALPVTAYGEYLELEFSVANNSRHLLLDVNVLGGDQIDLSSGVVGAAVYATHRGIGIQNTFQNPLKFYSRNIAQHSTFSFGINSPAISPENKMFIQIGPANSDTSFGDDLTSPTESRFTYTGGENEPLTLLSYFNSLRGAELITGNTIGRIGEGEPGEAFNFGLPIYPTASLPSNFGIGLPWHSMLNFYNEEISVAHPVQGMQNSRWLLGQTNGLDNILQPFWWRGIHPDTEWDNVPTAADENVFLTDVKIYRYFKKKIALTSIKKYIKGELGSGGQPTSANLGEQEKNEISNVRLQYSVANDAYRVRLPHGGQNITNSTLHTLLLRTIVNVPLEEESLPVEFKESPVEGPAKYPTTFFSYSKLLDGDDGILSANWESEGVAGTGQGEGANNFLMANLPNLYIMDGYIGPLGNRKVIKYKKSGNGGSYAFITRSSPEVGGGYSTLTPYQTGTLTGGQIQDNFAAKFIALVDRTEYWDENEKLAFQYEYGNGQFSSLQTRPHDNLNESAVWNRETPGYESMKKIGPFPATASSTNNVPYTEYQHYIDPILKGKLRATQTYDEKGELVNTTQNDYTYELAFEPGAVRMRDTSTYSDNYMEYEYTRPALPGNESNNATFARYIFEMTGRNGDPTVIRPDDTIRPFIPRVSSMELYSPWTPSRGNNSGVTAEDTYGSNNRMASEASFFVKLNQSTSTDYMYCSEDETFGITTTTDYAYYSAKYDGTFDADVFGAIGPQIGENGRLRVVPSFLPAVKTTSNSHSPIKTTEQYFYHWDLKNVPGYLGVNGINQQEYPLLFKLSGTTQGAKPVRNLTYEVRTSTGDVTQSTFNVYSTEVPFEYQAYEHYQSELTVVCPSGGDEGGLTPDCEDAAGSSSECPNANGCYWTGQSDDDLPPGYCRQAAGGRMICPCSLEGEEEIPESDQESEDDDPLNFQGDGPAFSFKNFGFVDALGDGPAPYNIPSPEAQFIPVLKAVYVQVREGGGSGANVDFSEGLENPEFRVPVVKTHELTLRTPYNLPVETKDVKDLITHYDYAPVKVLHYQECVRNQFTYNLQTAFSVAAGLPVAITVGEGNDALMTTYEYDKRRTLISMTDPTNIVFTYSYDDFRRLEFSYRNGDLLSKNAYHNFGFKTQTYDIANYQYNTGENLENHVETISYLGNGGKSTTTQYLSHLGRQSGQRVVFDGGVGAPGRHISGAPSYDVFGRTVAVKDIGASEPFLTEGEDSANTNNAYAPAPRGQVLKSARAGLSLDDENGVFKTIETCMASDEELREVIVQAGNTSALDYLPGGSTIRKRIVDEDGRIYVSYSDGAGLGIATISYEAGEPYAATVNQFDGRGNLLNSVNPKEQVTSYKYNYLGQPYEMTSPDAGTTKIAYNVEGGVLSTINGDSKQTSFLFDAFGRQVKQTDGASSGAFVNEGLPWLDLLDHPWSYTVPFGDESDSKIEKVWQYNELNDSIDLMEMPANFSSDNSLGRLAAAFSYDEEGEPVHGTTFKYNNDGFVSEEVSIFKNTGDEPIAYSVEYSKFLLTGAAGTVSVDVNNDGPDFSHHFAYDGLGRLTSVSLSVPDREIANQKYAEYNYNSDNTQLETTTYFSEGGEVMGISNQYDVANRLTSMSSPLYTENIIYDKGNEGYFNGNIYSVESVYGIAPYLTSPSTMGESSTYKYSYDGLNRLTKANLELDGNIFQHIENVAGNLENFGTVEYGYDKIGNLENILRGEFNGELGQIGTITSAMSFPDQNSQLESTTQSGLGFASPSTFGYEHNGAGYLTSDGRTGKSITYTRGTYPLTAGGDKFVYDVNDARIHKKGEKNEFYLRNGAGQELAVIDLNELTASWYAFGLTRFAEIGTSIGDCGEVPCRPEPPVVDGSSTNYDAIALSNAQATNSSQLNYPITLFRVQLPSDNDAYLLGSEFDGLEGHFNILQQILINSEDDILTVENINTEVIEEISFADFLVDRQGQFHDLLVNGFHVCREECQEDVFACSDLVSGQQRKDIKQLRKKGFTNDGQSSFTIVRIRLCNGYELYADQAELENIRGAFLILQEIDVDPTDFNGISFENSSTTGTVSVPVKVGEYLYDVSNDWSLDGYTPCFTIEPCAEETPACLNGEGPDYDGIRDVLNANSVVTYPAKLRRIRFCDGKEMHLLANEIRLLSNAVSYKLLQEVIFLSSSQKATVYESNGSTTTMTLEDLLPLRKTGRISRVDDYPDCVPQGCEVPNCSETDAITQQEAIYDLLQDPSTRLSDVSFPLTLQHVISCAGKEYWLSEIEAGLINGLSFSGKTVRIENASTTFAIQLNEGDFQTVNFENYLAYDQQVPFKSVNGLQSCFAPDQGDCQGSDASDCNSTIGAQQISAIQSLSAFSQPCSSQPDELNFVELCGGETVYLTDEEVGDLPGRVTILSRIVFEPGITHYDVITKNGEERVSLAELYCSRFNDISLILTEDCEVINITETKLCSLSVTVSDLQLVSTPNSTSVNVVSEMSITETCDGELVSQTEETISQDFSAQTYFRGYLSNQYLGYQIVGLKRLIIREVLSNQQIILELTPEAMEAAYPNIVNDLGITIIDEISAEYHHQISTSASPYADYQEIINSVIDYCIAQHAGASTVNSSIWFEYDYSPINTANPEGPGNHSVLVSSRLYHQPTRKTYVIDPCEGNVVLDLIVKGIHKEEVLFPVFEVTQGKLPFCFRSITSFSESADPEGAKQIKCLDDEEAKGCNGFLTTTIDPTNYNCSPPVFPALPYVVSPTIAAHLSNDLTQLFDISAGTGHTTVSVCEETVTTQTLDCVGSDPPLICYGGNCSEDPCDPLNDTAACTAQDIQNRDVALLELKEKFTTADADDVIYPTQILKVTFCEGIIRYLLPSEMTGLTARYIISSRIDVADESTDLRINNGNWTTGNLNQFIQLRKTTPEVVVEPLPNYTDPAPGLDPVTGLPGGGNQVEVKSPLTFYLFDHLGNTRVTFRADAADAISITYAADYYPYGKILREYNSCKQNRYLSTHHERDQDTGYDNRGARLYDSEIGRFTGVDPLASDYAGWSSYNYVLGNPIRLVDPDGRAPDDVIIRITDKVVGSTQIRLIGSGGGNGAPSTVEVPLYLMTVTDDVTGTVSEYHVARDGPVVDQSNPVNNAGAWAILGFGDTYNIENTAFEPASGQGDYKGVALAYPKETDLEAFALRTQNNSPNLPTDPARGSNSAEGVMIHVGGNYVKSNGERRITGSLGCFGLCGKDEGNQGVKNFVKDVVGRRNKNRKAGAGSAINIQVDKRKNVDWTWKVDGNGTKQ
jgi:RHS repeat-associated protein